MQFKCIETFIKFVKSEQIYFTYYELNYTIRPVDAKLKILSEFRQIKHLRLRIIYIEKIDFLNLLKIYDSKIYEECNIELMNSL